MKLNRHLFFNILFVLSIFVGTLHSLKHASHSVENCQICILEQNNLGSDHNDYTVEQVELQHYDVLSKPLKREIHTSFTSTLFGRAPPVFS